MRICSPQLGIAPNATLGGEVYDRETLQALAARGVECEIILPTGTQVSEVENWHISRIPLRRGYRWFVSNPLFVPYIGQVYRKRPFHLLRVHSLRYTGLAALWARKRYKLPVPIVMHHHHLDGDRWTNQIDRTAAQQADLIITVSQFAKDQLIDAFKLDPNKVVFAYNGVNESYKPVSEAQKTYLRQQNGVDKSPLLLHVGSLIPRKNLPFLMKIFQQVLQQFPTAKLWLVGQGPQFTALKNLGESLGIASAVHFAGHLSENDKLHAYQMADLLVSSSLMEGFGLAVVEAMACGLPVVAGQVGALPEVIHHQKTGLLVPPNDHDSFVDAICQILQNKPMADYLGQAGNIQVNTLFRWQRTAAQIEEFYRELI